MIAVMSHFSLSQASFGKSYIYQAALVILGKSAIFSRFLFGSYKINFLFANVAKSEQIQSLSAKMVDIPHPKRGYPFTFLTHSS